MIYVKGITWDHPRGYDSILAATEEFHKIHQNIKVTWDIRSLKEFGDLPISSLINQYDLLMIDHPFVGEAHVQKILLPMGDMLSEEFLEAESGKHIGICYESYAFEGRQYALPIDGAAQFSAFNSKTIPHNEIPANWKDYVDSMNSPGFSSRVIWPLSATDLWCSFLTIAAQLGIYNGDEVFDEYGLTEELAIETIEFLKQLTEKLAPQCWSLNPIKALELMTNTDHFGYSPLVFGYNNYGRGNGNIEFINAISIEANKPIALLGGVGIAVSSKTKLKEEIADYLYYILKEEVISGTYFDAGGQPSLTSAWRSGKLNNSTNNFFRNTTASMEQAYVRPCIPGFNDFQEKVSTLIHHNLTSTSSRYLIKEVNNWFLKICT